MVIFIPEQSRDFLLFFNGFAVIFFFFLKAHFRFVCFGFSLVNQCFGRDTTDVDTSASVHFFRAFDYGYLPIVPGQFGGECFTAFAETYNDGIILFHGRLF